MNDDVETRVVGIVTPAQLQQRNRELAAELSTAQHIAQELRHRSEVAEKTARDAWGFVKALRSTGQK